MKENNLQIELIEGEESDIKIKSDPKKRADVDVEVKDEEENLTQYYKSTIFGKLFFNWSRFSMTLANKNSLKVQDFRGISEGDKSQNLYKALSEKWKLKKEEFKNQNMKENSFYLSILNTYYKRIIVLTILNLCVALLDYIQIYFYDSVIQNFECS